MIVLLKLLRNPISRMHEYLKTLLADEYQKPYRNRTENGLYLGRIIIVIGV
jgi:hypothetical protein